MMASQETRATLGAERDALFPNPEIYNPYELVHHDDAYPIVQHAIVEFADFQTDAIASGDMDRIGNAIKLEKHVKRLIRFQLESGKLVEAQIEGDGVLDYATNSYFIDSLKRYRKYGLDPALLPAVEEDNDFIPTPGVNISQEEYDRLFAIRQPEHITEPEADYVMTAQEVEVNTRFQGIVQRMKKLGKKSLDALMFPAPHSEEITLPPTRVLDQIAETKVITALR